MTITFALFAGIATCLVLLRALEVNAGRLGLLDRPVEHKAHTHPTPAVGGLGITLAIFLCAELAAPASDAVWVYLGILGLVTLGAIDDVRHLSARFKLYVMLVFFSTLLWRSDNLLYGLGELWPTVEVTTALAAFPLTLLAALGVVNAFNLIDGADGLAGSVAACTFTCFLLLAWQVGAHEWMPFIALCLGTVLAFLAFNLRLPRRPRARIFLGDAGSLVIGFILFWLSVSLSHRVQGAAPPIVMVWLLAFPMLDTVATMCLRIREHKSVFSPGHDHFHHLLQRAGVNVPQTVLVAVALTAALSMSGLALWHLGAPDWVSLLLFLAITACYIVAFLRAWARLGRPRPGGGSPPSSRPAPAACRRPALGREAQPRRAARQRGAGGSCGGSSGHLGEHAGVEQDFLLAPEQAQQHRNALERGPGDDGGEAGERAA